MFIYEYSKNCNPELTEVPPGVFPSEIYNSSQTKIYPLDTKSTLRTIYPATCPNLLANFIKIMPNEKAICDSQCTSNLFYIIKGEGIVCNESMCSTFFKGDLFVWSGKSNITLSSRNSECVLYWVNDSPLLEYLGVKFDIERFIPTFFRNKTLFENLEKIIHDSNNHNNNRLGILLSNENTDKSTKTITHVLWALLNCLPKNSKQRPHKHNSVALDLCVSGGSENVYTLMGPELDENGWVKNPLRINWENGGVFITPPGWYHSHHNDSDVDAIVLPIQDAGLYTYQRTLDITFSP